MSIIQNLYIYQLRPCRSQKKIKLEEDPIPNRAVCVSLCFETDQCEYTNMQEMFQRQLDEIRDLKSDREVREKLNKAIDTKKSSDSRREKIIVQTPPPR